MPQIDVPVDVYENLAARAAERGTTVEAITRPVLEYVAQHGPEFGLAKYRELEERNKLFDEMMAHIHNVAPEYPPGFEADVSRESIYEGCGE